MAKIVDEINRLKQQSVKKKRNVVGIGITLTEEEESILKEEAKKNFLSFAAYIRKITADFIKATKREE